MHVKNLVTKPERTNCSGTFTLCCSKREKRCYPLVFAQSYRGDASITANCIHIPVNFRSSLSARVEQLNTLRTRLPVRDLIQPPQSLGRNHRPTGIHWAFHPFQQHDTGVWRGSLEHWAGDCRADWADVLPSSRPPKIHLNVHRHPRVGSHQELNRTCPEKLQKIS